MMQSDIKFERQQHATEITNRLKVNIASVLNNYPVELAYLPGSVARGCPLPDSDVDIALLLTGSPTSYERLTLELDIQAAIEDACGLSDVDVRTLNSAPLMVQGGVVQEGILLYSRNKERRVAFEVLTRKKYFDYQPTAARMQEAFLNHIQKEGLLSGQSKNQHLYSEKPPKLPGEAICFCCGFPIRFCSGFYTSGECQTLIVSSD